MATYHSSMLSCFDRCLAILIIIGMTLCDGGYATTKKSAVDSVTVQNAAMGMAPKNERNYNQGKTTTRTKRDRIHAKPLSEQEDDSNGDDLQMVTIDLSALRPSLPGLVLHRYGEMAPKLVQIDLDVLNPQLQPHIIWPEFQEQMGNLDNTYFDFVKENFDMENDIPLFTSEESLIATHSPKLASMTASNSEWPNLDDLADGDMYDFMPGSIRNEDMMILHQTLPLADEVIVPLDWEAGQAKANTNRLSAEDKGKRNVFVSRGWTPGGYSHRRGLESVEPRPKPRGAKSQDLPVGVRYRSLFGTNGWRPGKRRNVHNVNKNIEREEPEDTIVETPRRRQFLPQGVTKNKHFSSQYSQDKGQVLKKAKLDKEMTRETDEPGIVKISSQESWTKPKQQWGMPKLFATY